MLFLYINCLSGAQYVELYSLPDAKSKLSWMRGKNKNPPLELFSKHPIILKEQECKESLKKAITSSTYTSLLSFFKFVKNIIQGSRNKDLRPGGDKILQEWQSCTIAAIRTYQLLPTSISPFPQLASVFFPLPPHPFFLILKIHPRNHRAFTHRRECVLTQTKIKPLKIFSSNTTQV